MSTEAHILAITIAQAKLTSAQQGVLDCERDFNRGLVLAEKAVRDATLVLEAAVRNAGGYES